MNIDEAIERFNSTDKSCDCPLPCIYSCSECIEQCKQIAKWLEELKELRKNGYNAGYKKAFEETIGTVKYYADMWDGIYQAIDELEEKWKEWEDKNTYE